MNLYVCKTAQDLGRHAASMAAQKLREAIAANGSARLVLSTGASQLTTLEPLLLEDVDWTKVTLFHLDEYCDLPITHKASFRKYLTERFISKISLAAAHLVDGNPASIPALSALLREKPIDLGLIGIGENAHIAFNDPPADFDTTEAYIAVRLAEECKQQQVNENWFPTLADVPTHAITMTAREILKCQTIISCVPYAAKAVAVQKTMMSELSNMIPSTLLHTHGNWHLFVDADSAALLDKNALDNKCGVCVNNL